MGSDDEETTCRDRRPLAVAADHETTGPFHTDGGHGATTFDDEPPGSLPGGSSRPGPVDRLVGAGPPRTWLALSRRLRPAPH